MTDEPSCAWCDATQTLERIHGTEGDAYYVCSCCAETTRIDWAGVAHRVDRREPVTDVSGHVIDGE